MPLTENNILFYWTAPDGRLFVLFAEPECDVPAVNGIIKSGNPW